MFHVKHISGYNKTSSGTTVVFHYNLFRNIIVFGTSYTSETNVKVGESNDKGIQKK